MPRGTKGQESPAKQLQNRLLWDIAGEVITNSVGGWDLKTDQFTSAILEIIATGATVVLRPGSGGRSIGIAIWEGDVRHAPTWLYAEEEADAWAGKVLQRVAVQRGMAAD